MKTKQQPLVNAMRLEKRDRYGRMDHISVWFYGKTDKKRKLEEMRKQGWELCHQQ